MGPLTCVFSRSHPSPLTLCNLGPSGSWLHRVMVTEGESVLRASVASSMFEVISTRRAIEAQRTVVRMGCVQVLRQPHRLVAAIARRAGCQPSQQVGTDVVVHRVVPAVVPAATLGVACSASLAGTGGTA